jgi:nucleoside diphosphate kinase
VDSNGQFLVFNNSSSGFINRKEMSRTLVLLKPDALSRGAAPALRTAFQMMGMLNTSPKQINHRSETRQDTENGQNAPELGEIPRLRLLRLRLEHFPRERAELFYAEHKGKFFEKRLVDFMVHGGPTCALLVEGDDPETSGNTSENAPETAGNDQNALLRGPIATWREIQGATHSDVAMATPFWTFRGRFGSTDTRNASHGSDSAESAAREIAFFFPDFVET